MAESDSRGRTSIGIRPLRRFAERNPQYPLVVAFKRAGVDLLDPAALPDRVDHAFVAEFLARAPELLGEECVGLNLAAQVEPADLDILHYIARTSPTVRAAVEKCGAQIALLHDGLQLELRPDDDGCVRICFELPRELLVPRAMADVALGFTLKLARHLAGVSIAPVAVHYRNPAPRRMEPYRSFYGAPCFFDSDAYCLTVNAATLDLPIPSADPLLCELLEEHARQLTAPLASRNGFSDQVRQIVVKQLSGGNPDISYVARHLHLSPRTLRRRLEREGATYQELLNELRVTLAKRYLDDLLGVEEVAFLLGYSSSHAFRRAFKRNTGFAPLAYRGRAESTPGAART